MSSRRRPVDADLSTALKSAMHEHWGLFLAEGVVLSVLGLAAIIAPPLAGLAATIVLGWLFLIAGVVGLVSTFRTRRAPGFGWSLASALAALIAGGVLLWNPFRDLATLTYVLIAFFIVDGTLIIVLAVAHHSNLSGKWEWMLVNGIIDLILAAVIVSLLPASLVWALRIFVGIDMAFGGATLVIMALEARTFK